MNNVLLLALRPRITSHYHSTSNHYTPSHSTTHAASHGGGGAGLWAVLAVVAVVALVFFVMRRVRRTAQP